MKQAPDQQLRHPISMTKDTRTRRNGWMAVRTEIQIWTIRTNMGLEGNKGEHEPDGTPANGHPGYLEVGSAGWVSPAGSLPVEHPYRRVLPVIAYKHPIVRCAGVAAYRRVWRGWPCAGAGAADRRCGLLAVPGYLCDAPYPTVLFWARRRVASGHMMSVGASPDVKPSYNGWKAGHTKAKGVGSVPV